MQKSQFFKFQSAVCKPCHCSHSLARWSRLARVVPKLGLFDGFCRVEGSNLNPLKISHNTSQLSLEANAGKLQIEQSSRQSPIAKPMQTRRAEVTQILGNLNIRWPLCAGDTSSTQLSHAQEAARHQCKMNCRTLGVSREGAKCSLCARSRYNSQRPVLVTRTPSRQFGSASQPC